MHHMPPPPWRPPRAWRWSSRTACTSATSLSPSTWTRDKLEMAPKLVTCARLADPTLQSWAYRRYLTVLGPAAHGAALWPHLCHRIHGYLGNQNWDQNRVPDCRQAFIFIYFLFFICLICYIYLSMKKDSLLGSIFCVHPLGWPTLRTKQGDPIFVFTCQLNRLNKTDSDIKIDRPFDPVLGHL
jgi:hypothetical protein